MSIVKWEIYCNTETEKITGYLDFSEGPPTLCFHNNTHSIDTSQNKLIEKIHTNHSKEINQWKIFCDTEQIYTYGYLDNLTPPTECFNNRDHIISQHPEKTKTIHNNNFRIEEESVETGGHFQSVSYKMVCPAGDSNHDYSFIYPISALSITLNTTSDHTDDELEVIIGPDTIVGGITSDVSISDTVINVSSTVIENIKVGFFVNLFDGTNTDNLGRVIGVDTVLSTITLETAATQSFLAATPTYVRMTVKSITDFVIGYPTRYEVGRDKIGGSHIPTGTIIRVKYTNNGVSSKNFYAMIELLY